MKSVSELLADRAQTIRELIDELLDHSSLHHYHVPGFFSTAGDNTWGKLEEEGRRTQSRALTEHQRYSELLHVLLHGQPPDAMKALDESEETLERVLQQSGSTWWKTVDEARAKVDAAIEAGLGLVADLYDPSEGTPVFVPDTNALYRHPNLDASRFRGFPRFVLLLLSNVLAELDEAKVNHRNPDVRKKAEGLIGRVRSYHSRGDIFAGVPLAKDKSTVKTSAIEPRVEDSLPWLDPSNRDDRIVASLIEATRAHPRSPVVLVTRDVNLQNKAAFAGLPFRRAARPASYDVGRSRKVGSGIRSLRGRSPPGPCCATVARLPTGRFRAVSSGVLAGRPLVLKVLLNGDFPHEQAYAPGRIRTCDPRIRSPPRAPVV